MGRRESNEEETGCQRGQETEERGERREEGEVEAKDDVKGG